MTTTGERVLEIARRIVKCEAELAELRNSLEGLLTGKAVVGPPPSPPPSPGPTRTAVARRPRRVGSSAAAVDVLGEVLTAMRERPNEEFRAGDFRDRLAGRSAKGSIESALQRLKQSGQVERRGRGLYRLSGIPRKA
jgi:hypothetical protein